MIVHLTNMTLNAPAEQQRLRVHRKRIETCNHQREQMGVARLHVRLATGVSLKIAASLCALSVTNYCEMSNQGMPTLRCDTAVL